MKSEKTKNSCTDKKRYGVLGKHLPHTYSPFIHGCFADYPYDVIELEESETEAFFKSGRYDGFNVTIPYKKTAAALCDSLSDAAKAVGSVNTVVRCDDGRLIGDNTDVFGFEYMLRCAGIDIVGKRCLVLGTGGAAAAVRYVLSQQGASAVKTVSRSGEINYGNVIEKAGDSQIIINTTPVGMYPNSGASPLVLDGFDCAEAVCDIIYNPFRTRLLSEATAAGLTVAGGADMLTAQAYKSSCLFTGKNFSPEEASAAIKAVSERLIKELRNITLIGMPGSGKSTVGRALAEVSGREFTDLDTEYTERFGETPEKTIITHGEALFRDREALLCREILPGNGRVISCGGGAVVREENRFYIRCNSLVIYLERPLSALASEGRPLSAGGTEALYSLRKEFYERTADVKIYIPAVLSAAELVKQAINKTEAFL